MPQLCTFLGELQCTCKLSGMPDLTLSFSQPQILVRSD